MIHRRSSHDVTERRSGQQPVAQARGRGVDDVVPELQRRGRLRVEYAGATLRDILRQER
jgi:hypothetical protein